MTKSPTGRPGGTPGSENGQRRGHGGDRHAKGGPKGRREAQAPVAQSRIEAVRTEVEKRPGVAVVKVSEVNRATHTTVGVKYYVEFTGCEPLEYAFLSAARERAKEPPPVPDSAPSEAAQEPDEAAGEPGAADTSGENA